MIKFLKKSKKKKIYPINAANILPSFICSAHDDYAQPSQSLISLSLEAIKEAQRIDLSDVSKRFLQGPYYPDFWPGEHYKLLAGFVKALKPKVVIEMGTYTGVSSLSMKKFLPETAKLYSFDIMNWQEIPGTILQEADFQEGNFFHFADDLALDKNIEKHRQILSQAEIIFIDITHDGLTEEKILQQLEKISFSKKMILILDDIRLWDMVKFFREINRPKIDLTSFGHWSGTGVVEWINKEKCSFLF